MIKPMKLLDLKKAIDAGVERAGDVAKHVDVEFWLGDEELEMDTITQCSLTPDVTIVLKQHTIGEETEGEET